jgi:ADP-heptose:LPS heptosyltransferase
VSLIKRHFYAAWYVLAVILPVLLRTGRRPVIFSRYAGMGDIVGTIPAALELKKRHAGATFIYNCAASFACLPVMGGVTEHVTHLHPIGLISHWYRWLLSGYYNFGSDDDEFIADHQELFLEGYARRHGVTVAGVHPRLQTRPAVLATVQHLREKLGLLEQPLVLIHPGPTWPVKQWPQASWPALVTGLRGQGVKTVVQVGTGVQGYSNLGASDALTVPGVVSLVDKLSLEESLALISMADLFLGVDSGLLHGAVSFGVPAVGVWGATSPRFLFAESESRAFVVSLVECQGCHHRVPRLHWMSGCPYDIRCMKEITVEQVLRVCRDILSAKKS